MANSGKWLAHESVTWYNERPCQNVLAISHRLTCSYLTCFPDFLVGFPESDFKTNVMMIMIKWKWNQITSKSLVFNPYSFSRKSWIFTTHIYQTFIFFWLNFLFHFSTFKKPALISNMILWIINMFPCWGSLSYALSKFSHVLCFPYCFLDYMPDLKCQIIVPNFPFLCSDSTFLLLIFIITWHISH